MNKQKVVETVKQEFMLKRVKAQEESEEFLLQLRTMPEFETLYSNLSKLQIAMIKSQIEQDQLELKNQIETLQEKIKDLLKIKNIDATKLEPHYDCPLCHDTGVCDGKICACFLTELNKRISLASSCQTSFKSFDMANIAKMNDQDIKAMNWLKLWCEHYPKVTKLNINLLGTAGSGKTFLLECVANQLMKQGVAVGYLTAFELNEQARLYHIGKAFEFADTMKVDVLLIDDLGTEPILKNVTKEYLYNLINVRQINKLPTIITTNLNFDNILSRYDDRIFSRLGNKNLSTNIQLTSMDKRL